MMLKFYGYFKQATEGSCAQSGTRRPAFWEIIKRQDDEFVAYLTVFDFNIFTFFRK